MSLAEACRDTVLRLARAQDTQDWDALVAAFTEDAVLVRPGAEPLHGRDAIRAAYAGRAPGRFTRHLVVSTVVDETADGEAHAHSTVLLWAGHAGDAEGPQGRPAQGPELLGEFDDRLRRGADGRWRIAERRSRFVLHR